MDSQSAEAFSKNTCDVHIEQDHHLKKLQSIEESYEALLKDMFGSSVPKDTLSFYAEIAAKTTMENAIDQYFINDGKVPMNEIDSIEINDETVDEFEQIKKNETSTIYKNNEEKIGKEPLESKDTGSPDMETNNNRPSATSAPSSHIYNVEMKNCSGNFQWKVSNVFGRIVVQAIIFQGPAHLVGIKKSDVMVSYNNNQITEDNITFIIDTLNSGCVNVPVSMTFRRSEGSILPIQTSLADSLHQLKEAINDKIDEIALINLIFDMDGNLDAILDRYFQSEDGVFIPSFNDIIGHEWFSGEKVTQWQLYDVVLPPGQLGLTVENIMERTVIVSIKAGGSADKAMIEPNSWVISINETLVTHLTHRETLQEIETANRPLKLRLCLLSNSSTNILRKQLATNTLKKILPSKSQDRISMLKLVNKMTKGLSCLTQSICSELCKSIGLEISKECIVEPSESVIIPEGSDDNESSERKMLIDAINQIKHLDGDLENLMVKLLKEFGSISERLIIFSEDKNSLISEDIKITLTVITNICEVAVSIENHNLWDTALDVLSTLTRNLPKKIIFSLIIPLITRLSISISQVSRSACVGLFPLVYPLIHGDIKVQLRGMLFRLGADDSPLVRRAVSNKLKEAIVVVGFPHIKWSIQLLETIAGDSHENVRIYGMDSCLALANILNSNDHGDSDKEGDNALVSPKLLRWQVFAAVSRLVSDQSWQVRLEAVKALPSICIALGPNLVDVVIDLYVSLVKDGCPEVIIEAIESSVSFSKSLLIVAGWNENYIPVKSTREKSLRNSIDTVEMDDLTVEIQNVDIHAEDPHLLPDEENIFGMDQVLNIKKKILQSILPATFTVSTSRNRLLRVALAKSSAQSISLLEKDDIVELIPVFLQLFQDSDSEVRGVLALELCRHGKQLPDMVIPELVIPTVKELASDRQWRNRNMALDCIYLLAENMNSDIMSPVVPVLLNLIGDPVCDVRQNACHTLIPLNKCFGVEWITIHIIPFIIAGYKSDYQSRMTAILAIDRLADTCKENIPLTLIETLLLALDEKVPRIRYRAIEALTHCIPKLSKDSFIFSELEEKIGHLSNANNEKDPEVREIAIKCFHTFFYT